MRCKHKNLAAGADLENCAAAVANVEIAVRVERDPCGDAHAFDPLLGAAFGCDAMNGAVIAAGDKKISRAIESEPAGIHQRSDERLHAVVRGDFIERNGNALAARAGERDVNVAFIVHRGIRDRMQVIRDLQSDMHGMRRALVAVGRDAHHAAARAFRNARDQTILAGER